MLYTSYYANPLLDHNKVYLVRISNSAPGNFPINYTFQEVMPTWETIVGPYKDGEMSENDYVVRYRSLLDSRPFNICMMMDTILKQAQRLNKEDIVFLCYEKPGKFCHRHIFAQWLMDNQNLLGINTGDITEYKNPYSVEPTLF